MQAIAAELHLEWRLIPYTDDDFNGIFAGLANGTYDCVASGATITLERERIATFCAPYVRSGQSLVCNIEVTPHIRSIGLMAEGKVAEVRSCAYHDIGVMLDDLEAGRIGAVMKLAPVIRWLTRSRPTLRVVQEGITDEKLGVAVRLGDEALRKAINGAQARLQDNGVLPGLVNKWIQG